ncbi:MAG: cell division protein FtsZ [Candidatus Pacebacteria bacterium]|nr:cell division protein FtsZ [Candidatus Paceibacterota bacterium]MDD5555457.1 cell division protein FtsZ [Candidatus Paceibacterota bacterium]
MNTKIKVIGIGGAGGNTISRLFEADIKNVELISVNTDLQDLNKKKAHLKIRIGEKITQGLGAGMKPEIGRLSAEENAKELEDILKTADIVFLTAGLGGGTGSGAMPVIAGIAKGLGVLTIGIVTLPFSFEGKKRRKIAQNSLEEMENTINTLVVIPNDKLLGLIPPKSSVEFAFEKCDELLKEAVESISNVISNPGILNLDFADVKEVLKSGGSAFFGIGRARGKDRVAKALDIALFSPLSDSPLEKLGSILFNIASGSNNFYLSEVKKIAEAIKKRTSSSAKVVFGASFDKNLAKDEIRLTIIATSLDQGQ